VVKISLLYTYFMDSTGRHMTVANPSILHQPIINLSRTPTHLEFVNIPVSPTSVTSLPWLSWLPELMNRVLRVNASNVLRELLLYDR